MSKQKKYTSADDHPYWETVKQLPTFQAKVEYTFENWWFQILSVVFIIVLISSVAISNYVNNIPSYLSGAYINMLTVDEMETYEKDYLDRAFLHDYLGIPENERITMPCYDELPLALEGSSATSEMVYNSITRLDAQIPANMLDYFVMTEDLVNWMCARYGDMYLDLREFLTEDELALYADRLRYTIDGIPVAIDISDSPLLADMCFTADKPVCFAWFAYVKKTENMRPFFDFLMSTLP